MRGPPSKHRLHRDVEEDDDADCSLQFNLLKEIFVSPVLKRLGFSKNTEDDDEDDDDDDDEEEEETRGGHSVWSALCFPVGPSSSSRETAAAIERVSRVNDEVQF